ncbi:MAG: OB-fold domain-containing protein [Halioglobus sp.]|nr:OB-fold domain-containing protein [Halioglobus sp.]
MSGDAAQGTPRAGVCAWGAYVPATRLPLSLIHGRPAREGGPQKAVAGFDEDAITLGVAAAVNCLHGIERTSVDALYFASTSSPFREKQAAAFAARALDLRGDIATVDFGGTLRAGAGALLAAVRAVQAEPDKQVLVIAADARLPAPRSALEMNTGDAAAAFLVGATDVQAVFDAASAVSDEIYDVWRGEHDDYLRSWEDRFNVKHGYADRLAAACRALFEQTGTAAGDYSRAVLYGPDARSLAATGRGLGFDAGAIQDGLFGQVGNCGAAFTPLLLAAALEQAQPGDRLLAGFYGDGAEALAFTVIAADFRPRVAIAQQLERGRPLRSYDSYLKGRNLDAGEHDRRGGEGVSATVHFRERDDDISFLGQRCRQCGTLHFPACRVCYRCHARDEFDAVRLSDLRGKVMSFSFDHFFPSPEPPLIVGMCEVENGARVYVQMCEAGPDELRCDMPVEFVFRRIHEAGRRPNYFWKSRPVRGAVSAGGAS